MITISLHIRYPLALVSYGGRNYVWNDQVSLSEIVDWHTEDEWGDCPYGDSRMTHEEFISASAEQIAASMYYPPYKDRVRRLLATIDTDKIDETEGE